MSLQYLLDRLAISDTITRGCTAIDTNQPDLFDQVFTQDAVIDYSPLWGPESYRVFRKWSQEWADAASEKFAGWRHLLSNMVVEIDGDTATVATDFHNPIIAKDQTVIHHFARYSDTLIRTSEGWRIRHRKTVALGAADPSTTK